MMNDCIIKVGQSTQDILTIPEIEQYSQTAIKH